MKNLIKKVSSVIVIALFIMGCSKNDEADAIDAVAVIDVVAAVVSPTNAELILGQWRLTESTSVNSCHSLFFGGLVYNWSGCGDDFFKTDKYTIKGNIISFIRTKRTDRSLRAHYSEIMMLNAKTLILKTIYRDIIQIDTYTKK